ncbi:MAG: ClpX C4-type zinc finger protein [Planctomycetes bacterium]|nr:ClpX C4-type zinc finger protein [Planctomycetota bacterium]
MQRTEDGGIVISCDFCGTDWDEVRPMIEGHHGSVICLDCLKLAVVQAAPAEGKYSCPLCLRDNIPATLPRWSHPSHPNAIACEECIHQAARAFHKDPDVDWKWERKKK